MKKGALTLLVFIFFFTTHAATYFWIGGATGNWTTFSNWSLTSGGVPATFYPGPNDAVIFDNGQTISVTYDLPGNDIGFSSFQVKNNTQLTLVNTIIPANPANVRSFTINSSLSTNYFEVVQAGSSLSLKSNVNAIFSLGSDNLSSGRMVFNGKVYCIIQDAFNTSAGPRLNGATDSIIINDLFYIGPSITSVGVNPVGNKFRFGPNGVYQIDKDGGIYLFAKWESGSLIKITGTRSTFPTYWNGFYPPNFQLGGFEIDAPNATAGAITNLSIPSSSGLIFQNDFKINHLGTSAGVRLTSAPNITIQGNLIINNGNVSLAGSTTTAGVVNVKGNVVVASGANLDLQASVANCQLKVGGQLSVAGTITELGTSTASAIEMVGTAPQTINLTGTLANDVSFTVNNSTGLIALSDITLAPGLQAKLNLISGNLNALTNNKIIHVRNPATDAILGGTASSHIIGKLKRTSATNGTFDFPVSDNDADLAKASVTVSNANTTDWTIEFVRSNPNAGIGLPAGITSCSPYRWDIARSGTTPADASVINLKYSGITGNGISNPATTQILRWNSAAWDSYGGNYDNAGGINTVSSPISQFGALCLGKVSAVTPVLFSTVLNTFGSVCVNTTAGPNSFVLTGTNLSAGNIIIGPLSGYSFSLTAGGTYTASLTLPQAGGTLSATTIYVKFTPVVVQNYNGSIPVSGGGATSLNVSASGSGSNSVTPQFTPVAAICSGATLNPLPTTSNNGINGSWSPALNNTQTTTYTFTPTVGQCAATATMIITVNTPVTPQFTQAAAICSGATLNPLPTTSNNGINGSWSPALNNTQTTTYTFTPTAGQCAGTATMVITVNTPVTPQFTQVTAICSGAILNPLPTTSNNGINGSWSPALNNTQTTTYIFTPAVGQCAGTATMTITVTPSITPVFTPVAAICSGATLNPLPTTSNNGINGSWSPALNNTQTTTYTFAPVSGQCAGIATMTITVFLSPVFTLQPSNAEVCVGGNVDFSAQASGSIASYQWQKSEDNGNTWTDINGASVSSYGVANAIQSMDSNLYRLIANGQVGCGADTSQVARIRIKNNCNISFIYPNPAPAGHFFVNAPLPSSSDSRSVCIYDSKGSLVFNKSYNADLYEVFATSLSAGVYHVVVRDRFGVKIKSGKVSIASH